MKSETYTIRWSQDRSLYFLEPKRGESVRGFWLAKKRGTYPVTPAMIKNPNSGVVAFDGYYRTWCLDAPVLDLSSARASRKRTSRPTTCWCVTHLAADTPAARIVTLEELAAEEREKAAFDAQLAARPVVHYLRGQLVDLKGRKKRI